MKEDGVMRGVSAGMGTPGADWGAGTWGLKPPSGCREKGLLPRGVAVRKVRQRGTEDNVASPEQT